MGYSQNSIIILYVIAWLVCTMNVGGSSRELQRYDGLQLVSEASGDGTADRRADSSSANIPVANPYDRWYNITGPVLNAVSFLYMVGVEGTGHHGVAPAVAAIAKTCNYHVAYENKVLRMSQSRYMPRAYRSFLNNFRKYDYKTTNKVLVFEDHSFPTDRELRNSTMGEKKSYGKYNLEWVYDQAEAVGVDIRFLYLTRNFYKTVASHIEFDGTFERHARVLHDFIWYIDAEYQRISAKRPGLWAALHYEWFRDMENCTALVSAVVDFAGWDRCDVNFACQVLRQTLRNSTKRAVNATNFAFAESLNTRISVPQLSISPTRSYNFTTVFSDRKPLSPLLPQSSRKFVVLRNDPQSAETSVETRKSKRSESAFNQRADRREKGLLQQRTPRSGKGSII